jgi:hypothetical protein
MKFLIPTQTNATPDHPNSHALKLRQAYEDFRSEFHLHQPPLTQEEIYETRETYLYLTANLPLSKAKWICLLGKLLYFVSEPNR